jgi:serine/threonine-protein kinase RsbW
MRAVIRLKVPGALKYRDLAVRVVAAACKLVGDPDKEQKSWSDQVISAFGEAFNNTAIHSNPGGTAGDVDIEIEIGRDYITIRVVDFGNSYDFTNVPLPDLDNLPESGMGIFIIRSFMDEVSYVAGVPNVLSMTKRVAT